jgi:ketosteroid isomerase-like protein
MSSDNVELVNEAVRRVNEAFRRVDDLSALARLWHLESRVTLAAGWPESGPFVGRDAIIRQFERGFADFSENHFEELEIAADSGEWVVATWVWRARGTVSGLDVQFDVAAAFRVRDGQLIEGHFRWNREQALEAADIAR